MNVLWTILEAAWLMLEEAGIYVLIGLVAAGLVHLFVSRGWMTRHLGGRGPLTVLKAALVGAPLPLCSCSVLPTAAALREKGAGRGATVSFLISTPETGFDSIAFTWALMGPVMAVARPVAAVATAFAAGLIETFRGKDAPPAEAPAPCPHCAAEGTVDAKEAAEACADDGGTCRADGHALDKGLGGRARRLWRFLAVELADEIGPTLALGLLLAGLIGAFVPEGFFERYLGSRAASMAVMLAVGLPLYVCATASTPMAAMLIAKGLSPGAALVFLLVGPATNLATVLTVGKMFGKASAAIYVGTIAVMSILFGVALDSLVIAWDVNLAGAEHHALMPAWLKVVGAVVLGVWLAAAVGRWLWRRWPRGGQAAAACEDCHEAGAATEAGASDAG